MENQIGALVKYILKTYKSPLRRILSTYRRVLHTRSPLTKSQEAVFDLCAQGEKHPGGLEPAAPFLTSSSSL